MKRNKQIERLLWSIALPGFGQLLNGQRFKGIFFILLEIYINNNSNLNLAIISSFKGDISTAIKLVNYQYLMFYPCVYVFAMWDAYKNADDLEEAYSFLPFVFAAYIGTVGVIYSDSFKINETLFGPIWLPIICLILGSLIGFLIKFLIKKSSR